MQHFIEMEDKTDWKCLGRYALQDCLSQMVEINHLEEFEFMGPMWSWHYVHCTNALMGVHILYIVSKTLDRDKI